MTVVFVLIDTPEFIEVYEHTLWPLRQEQYLTLDSFTFKAELFFSKLAILLAALLTLEWNYYKE